MKCIYCGFEDSKVIDSRSNTDSDAIRRRRECDKCGYRFTSYERIEEKPLMVIKKNGAREVFEPQKLERGLKISLEKRPVSPDKLTAIMHEIEDEAVMQTKGSHEIKSEEIGEMALKKLYNIDRVAYVRFASVYRMFNDVEEFINEIDKFSK